MSGFLSRYTPLLLLLIGMMSSCIETRKERESEVVNYREWSEIIASDTLRVGTVTSPTDFYFYRGEPFGLEYQKVSRFAEANKLTLDIRVTGSRDSLMAWISSGAIDLSITPFAMTSELGKSYDFSGRVDTIALVVVQNRSTTPLLRKVGDLNGKSIYVSSSSPAEMRLKQIVAEAALDSLHILPVDSLGDVDLIKSVADGEDTIRYAAVDTRLAGLFQRHHPTLDTELRISVPLRYSWMLHKGNQSLTEQISRFFSSSPEEEEKDLDRLLTIESGNYFRSLRSPLPTPTIHPGAISPYDEIFMQEAKRLGWHWSYLAAIAFTESRFIPDIVARSGARGLMGVMPATGRAYGVSSDQLLDPLTAVRVAVDCLRDNEKSFSNIRDTHERECFTLAAYNAGYGHVLDAMRLARKYSAPDSVWEGGVREYLLLKSTPKYFNDPVVKYGYVRGSETVKYVDNIMHLSALYQGAKRKEK